MKNATDITFLLDRSGSMADLINDVQGGYRAFVKQQQHLDGECAMTFIQFNSENPHEVIFEGLPMREVPKRFHFSPHGATPLLKALDMAIECTGARLRKLPEAERPDKVVIITMTDGEENASNWGDLSVGRYSKTALAEKIQHQTEKYNWQFLFLGTRFDAFAEASGIGIAPQYTLNFTDTPIGIFTAMTATSSNLSAYRSGARASMAYTVEQQDEAQNG